MKKWLCILAASMILLQCAGALALTQSDVAAKARDALLSYWTEFYRADYYQGHTGYLEIKNTRVFTIADPVSSNDSLKANDQRALEIFGDVAYVVEFLILTDYFTAEPYYGFSGAYDHVLVMKDGAVKVSGNNPFQRYRALTYLSDFSGIVAETKDLNDAFNGVFTLRK